MAGNISADASVSFQYNPIRTPVGFYLGQDGKDYARLKNTLGGDGVQDMHFSLQNLPVGRTITGLQVRAAGGGAVLRAIALIRCARPLPPGWAHAREPSVGGVPA